MIFGIVGLASSGKDTIFKQLVDHGWERIAFGDPLKECLYALNPMIYMGQDEDNKPVYESLQNLVDCSGWDFVKQMAPVRELLQRMGTEVGRNLISPHLWINLALPKIIERRKHANLVITDVRYENEAELVRRLNGKIIVVKRPGVLPPNDHDSEWLAQNIRDYDYLIQNDSTLDDLRLQLEVILSELREKDLLIPEIKVGPLLTHLEKSSDG